MKIKSDFVTNSSSASFIIQKINITELQILLIKHHYEYAKMYHRYNIGSSTNSGWVITETKDTIEGSTSMDNFDMLWILSEIGVDRDNIKYESY